MVVIERRLCVRSGRSSTDTHVTLPEGHENRPGVLYLPALGTTTLARDLASDAPDALLTLLRALTDAGFVTLRAEPLASNASLGATLAIHRASFDALRALDEVDAERLFVVGHSLGGMIAPFVAERPRGIVAYAAPSRAWSECMALSAARQLKLWGLSGEELARETDAAARLYRMVFQEGQPPEQVLERFPEIASSRASVDVAGGTIFGRDAAFFHDIEQLDLESAWRRQSSVLALFGDQDWIVDPDDHVRIAGWAQRGTALTLGGVDHWMQRHPNREESFRCAGRGEVDPACARVMIEWMVETGRSEP